MLIDFPCTSNKENLQKTVGAVQEGRQRGYVAGLPQKIQRPAPVQVSSLEFDAPVKKRSDPAEPLKKLEDIIAIQDYLIRRGKYRDNLIFTMGINTGLRCGDLLKLKVGQILTEDGTAYRDKVVILEEKTKDTRKVRKYRTFYLNDAVCDAADLYFEHIGQVDMEDYLFRCEGNRGRNSGKPLTVKSVDRTLKEVINDKLGIQVHASTHCMRKTFAYHMICSAPDRTRAIEFLQKILGHSSAAITLMYAGITDEEIAATYQSLNLGRRSPFGWVQRNEEIG